MQTSSYLERRGQVEVYFDRTASQAWARLTSDRPVSRIRATVRAGREQMKSTLLSWLPDDLGGRRILDAGCGTGMLAVEAARRGAEVVAVDLSETLIRLARERMPADLNVDFRSGDMLDERLGQFEHIVAMDSLIHYRPADMVDMLARLSARLRSDAPSDGRGHPSIVFTFAPRTPLLSLMHLVGRLFPRGNRAPSIEPVRPNALQKRIGRESKLSPFEIGRTRRIKSAFYICQAQELVLR